MNAAISYLGRQVVFCDANPQDYIEGLALRGQWYELPNLEFIRGLQVIGTYIDVGAYIGTCSIFFSLFCPATNIYSFEPQLSAYDKLVRNMHVNGASNYILVNAGLSDEPGRGRMAESLSNGGGSQLLTGDDVDVFTLDSFNLNASLLKIDVEGMELKVLQGAKHTLENVQHLFVEMWDEAASSRNGVKYTRNETVELLAGSGFKLVKELAEDLHYFTKEPS